MGNDGDHDEGPGGCYIMFIAAALNTAICIFIIAYLRRIGYM